MIPDPDYEPNYDPASQPALDAVADAVLDGSPTGVLPGADATNDDALMRELRVLAEVAALHRLGPDARRSPSALSIGQWGHLQVRGHVGRGSFGDVFRAWDPRLRRDVALKLLDVPSDDPTKRDWVLHEARCLAAVRHPNVVTVYGADRLDGRTGFWTEFIRGKTLADLVAARGPFDAADAAKIGMQLCAALTAVHDAGLLHRDVKATNAMREGTGRVVLLDFGASRDFVAGSGATAVAIGGHGPTGTPLYVAPELWRGQPATPQSDFYSLGVLLYFLVTGAYPVRGSTVRDVDFAHRAGRRVGLETYRTKLPAAFVRAVAQAIEPDPAKRFQTAAAFAEALGRATVELEASPSLAKRLVRHWRAMASVAVIVALAAYGAYLARPRPQIVGWGSGFKIPSGSVGHGSRDGRFLPYVDDQGDVRTLDVASGSSQLIERHDDGNSGVTWAVNANGARRAAVSGFTAMSRRGERVAYTWFLGADSNEYELRIANVDGSWRRTILGRRAVFPPEPVDWTPDGTNVLCWLMRAGGQRDLLMVSTVDRSVRVLHTDNGGAPRAFISPDGRYVAFEQLTPEGKPQVAILDTTERDARASARLLFSDGLSAFPQWLDATHLVVVRPEVEDPATADFWIADVVQGVLVGEPICVLKGIMGFAGTAPYELTGQASIRVIRTAMLNEVYKSTIDLRAGEAGLPTPLVSTALFHHLAPAFSPDGRFIAYFTGQPQAVQFWRDTPVLTILDTAANTTRQVNGFGAGRLSPQWLADSRHVMVWGADTGQDDRAGWYRIDVNTGRVEDFVHIGQLARFFRDGRGFVYEHVKRMGMAQDLGLFLRLPAAHVDRLLVAMPVHGDFRDFALSPDGTRLAFVSFTREAAGSTTFRLTVMDLESGETRDIIHASLPESLDLETWTPDGHSVLYARGTGQERSVWLVSAAGGASRDLHVRLPAAAQRVSLNSQGTLMVYPEQIAEQMLWTRPLPLTSQPSAYR